jgi:hypothetical protein
MFSSINRLLCLHTKTFTRVRGARMFTECQSCGHESEGITIGGQQDGVEFPHHFYSPETYARMMRTKEMSKARAATA